MAPTTYPITFVIAALALIGLGCPDVLAQADNSAPLPMRLSRPGMSVALPGGSQPFSLGVEEKHLGTPEMGVPLNSRESDLPVLSVQLLANYNLELIVDESMSMQTMDCPGFMSRWNWCGAQAHDLANQLTPFVPKGLTITEFAREYGVHPNASAQNIADLFDNPEFQRGTRLAEPLSDRLNNYFARRKRGTKPMLIAIITDGVPVPKVEPQMVIDTLIDASKHMQDPHEVTVVFFQIGGNDYKGKRYLQDLDDNLVNYGARYDIVRIVSFDHLQQVGLARALLDSIQDFARESRPDADDGAKTSKHRW
jgi:hypothetical protein